ncbi:MAG: SsrA-binding protein SmpB [Patescibacteria group bacterium]|jgi:SsrA-binding protein|nr:SsrA-binding protein SmpB [Patescibacteria group bacterium]
MAKKQRKSKNLINKKASFDYQFLESLETGLVLTGEEIKAIRANKVNLSGSHIKIIGGEAFWVGGIINVVIGDQQRTRKLLMHKEEIQRISGKSEEKGLTIIPKKIYLKHGKAKLEIALSRGKKLHDKREEIKKRDLERDAARSIKY